MTANRGMAAVRIVTDKAARIKDKMRNTIFHFKRGYLIHFIDYVDTNN